MPIECLIALVIWVIVAIIILYIVETLVGLITPGVPPQVWMLLRLLVGLIVLLNALECLGLLSTGYFYHRRP